MQMNLNPRKLEKKPPQPFDVMRPLTHKAYVSDRLYKDYSQIICEIITVLLQFLTIRDIGSFLSSM